MSQGVKSSAIQEATIKPLVMPKTGDLMVLPRAVNSAHEMPENSMSKADTRSGRVADGSMSHTKPPSEQSMPITSNALKR